jgi:hypothetical protein
MAGKMGNEGAKGKFRGDGISFGWRPSKIFMMFFGEAERVV